MRLSNIVQYSIIKRAHRQCVITANITAIELRALQIAYAVVD